MDLNKICFNIFGSCASRDVFSLTEVNKKYEVGVFVQSVSIISLFNRFGSNKIDINEGSLIGKTPFVRKMICADFTKTALDRFISEPSNWLLIDFASSGISLGQKKYKDGIFSFTKSGFFNEMEDEIKTVVDIDGYKTISANEISDSDLEYAVDEFIKNIIDVYPPERIILNECLNSNYIIKGQHIGSFDELDISSRNTIILQTCKLFSSKTKCRIIRSLPNTISNQSHKWGPHPMHYIQTVYNYMAECIDNIVSGQDDKALDEANKKYCGMLDDIISFETSNQNKIDADRTYENNIKRVLSVIPNFPNEDRELLLNYVLKTSESCDNKTKAFIQREYAKLIDDASKKIEFYTSSFKNGNEWAAIELANFILRTPGADAKISSDMCNIIIEAKGQNRSRIVSNAYNSLARMWRDGRLDEGVDIEKSKHYFKQASNLGHTWSNIELLNLINCDSEEELAFGIVSAKKIIMREKVNTYIANEARKFLSNKPGEKTFLYRPIIEDVDSKTFIFQISHPAFLSQMILIKMLWYPNIRSVLLVNSIFYRPTLYNKLEKNGIFDRIIVYNGKTAYSAKTEESANKEINLHFTSLFEDAGIEQKSIGMAYTGCDLVNLFGIFLTNYDIPFTLVELTSNQLFDKSRIDGAFNLKIISASLHELQRKSGILDGSLGSYDVLLYPESTKEKINTKIIPGVFDYDHGYSLLKSEEKTHILSCFDINQSILSKEINLLLPNSIGFSVGNSSYKKDNFYLLYQLMLDYYLIKKEKSLVIKPHPSDNDNLYQNYFPDAVILNKDFPMEFINLVDDLSIKNTISGITSATKRIRDRIDNNVEAGRTFYKMAPIMHRIFFIFEISKKLDKEIEYYQNFTTDVNFFMNYCQIVYGRKSTVRKTEELCNSTKYRCIFVEDIYQLPLGLASDKKTIIVFFNDSNNIAKIQNFNEMAFELKLTKCVNTSLMPSKTEVIRILCDNETLYDEIKCLHIFKELPYTGMTLEAKCIDLSDGGD